MVIQTYILIFIYATIKTRNLSDKNPTMWKIETNENENNENKNNTSIKFNDNSNDIKSLQLIGIAVEPKLYFCGRSSLYCQPESVIV